MQVPSTGPNTRERQRRIAQLKRALAELESGPLSSLEDEHVDVRARSIRIAIDELEGRRPVPNKPIPDALEELLRGSPETDSRRPADRE